MSVFFTVAPVLPAAAGVAMVRVFFFPCDCGALVCSGAVCAACMLSVPVRTLAVAFASIS